MRCITVRFKESADTNGPVYYRGHRYPAIVQRDGSWDVVTATGEGDIVLPLHQKDFDIVSPETPGEGVFTYIFRCKGVCDGESCILITEHSTRIAMQPPTRCPYSNDEKMSWTTERVGG